jgi:UDP-glucose 4-epimerase
MKEHNVIGAMQLFAAAQKSSYVRKVVVKSTTAVYGSSHDDPALFREEAKAATAPSDGYAKDATEVEGYARSFGRRRRDVDLTILRFANFLGGQVNSTIASFFALPVVPIVFGYDPRLQFIHEDDAVEVLRQSVLDEHAGVYNVAGDGVVYLSQCIRLAGRIPIQIPRPAANAVGSLVQRSRRVDFSNEQLRFLQFGRAGDTTALHRDFDIELQYSSRRAFEDFVARRRIKGVVNRDEVVRWERELYDFLQRKGQERFVAARRRGM